MSQNITVINCTIRKILQFSTSAILFFETPGRFEQKHLKMTENKVAEIWRYKFLQTWKLPEKWDLCIFTPKELLAF